MALFIFNSTYRLLAIAPHETANLPSFDAAILWYDLHAPTREEEQWVESRLGIQIPTREELRELELSNRLYEENGAMYCTATIVTKAETTMPEIHSVSFILLQGVLVTLRYSDPSAFTRIATEINAHKHQPIRATEVMAALLEALVNRVADVLENSSHLLDTTHRALFRPALQQPKQRQQQFPNIEALLRDIGVQGDVISKLRESLLSMSRVCRYAGHSHYFAEDAESHAMLDSVQRDISALNDHATFLSSKVSFLLDASLGVVGLQQTAIIKILSVASVVFLPPTLIASVYGMNFQHMPELGWKLAYPLAVVLMLLSALLPYAYFRKKKWL
jgi:magnesium transporter